MYDASCEVSSFVRGKTKVAFEHDRLLERHPDIPWKNMKGMRNRIAHGYFDINMEIVWSTAQTALPRLIEQLKSIQQKK